MRNYLFYISFILVSPVFGQQDILFENYKAKEKVVEYHQQLAGWTYTDYRKQLKFTLAKSETSPQVSENSAEKYLSNMVSIGTSSINSDLVELEDLKKRKDTTFEVRPIVKISYKEAGRECVMIKYFLKLTNGKVFYSSVFLEKMGSVFKSYKPNGFEQKVFTLFQILNFDRFYDLYSKSSEAEIKNISSKYIDTKGRIDFEGLLVELVNMKKSNPSLYKQFCLE